MRRHGCFSNLSCGISNGSLKRAEHDHYITPPCAIYRLFKKLSFESVWECACGEGCMADAIAHFGKLSFASDKFDYGYDDVIDFLTFNGSWSGDIITNPPYCACIPFIYKGYSLLEEGRKLVLFLPLRYLEGSERQRCFRLCPLKYVFVSVHRIGCSHSGNVISDSRSGISYAWFIWGKGYSGDVILDWF